MPPLEYGGDMIDVVDLYEVSFKEPPYKFETGTPMIASAIGLGTAVDYINRIGYEFIENHEKKLREYLLSKMKELKGITIYNPNTDTGILLFNVSGVHPHDAASFFDEKNIAIRAGHHCAQPLMHSLHEKATLRASLYFYNTKEDIDKFIDAVKGVVQFFERFK